MKNLFFALMVVFLTGCAVPYVAPSTGATSTIRFVNDSQKMLEISFYEISSGCKRRRITPIILPATEAVHSVYADKELTFQYYLSNQGRGSAELYCLVNIRFTPKTGSKYSFLTSEVANQCKWIMFDDTDVARTFPVKLDVIPWSRGASEDGSFCDK